MSEPDARPDSLPSTFPWQQHLGLMVTGCGLVLAALRLLGVSKLNPVTAIAILQEGGSVHILLGTLILIIPFTAIFFMMILTQAWARMSWSQRGVSWLITLTYAFIFLPIFLWMVIAYIIVRHFVSVSIRMVTTYRHLSVWGTTPWYSFYKPDMSAHSNRTLAGLSGIALLILVLFTGPWLTPEAVRVNMDSSDQTIAGYVLSTDNGSNLVLLNRLNEELSTCR